MSILTKKIGLLIDTKVKFNKYKKLGYDVELGKICDINIENIPISSRCQVNVECDDCGAVFCVEYRSYNINSNFPKMICRKCLTKKKEDRFEILYGVRNPSQLQSVINKRKETNKERYGVEVISKSDKIKEKIKMTCQERYGCDSHLSNASIRDKIHKTNMERYGVNTPFESKEFREKALETIKKKYGVNTSPFQNKEIRNKAIKTIYAKYGVKNIASAKKFYQKSLDTKQKKYGKLAFSKSTSKQQEHICCILNGRLNIRLNSYILDIVFDEYKVCEYDGGGHNLSVKLGKITQNDFDLKEKKRELSIISYGYKILRLISNTDKLPEDSKIIEIKNLSLKYFERGFNIFRYYLDKNTYNYE